MVFSRDPSNASCVVTATAWPCGVVFPDILLGTCCLVTVDCSSLASRGSLFVMILLLLSGPDGFESVALLSSAFSPSITASPPVSSLLLGWIIPCASSGPVPIVTSLVSASCAVLVAVLGLVPDADDPPYETEGRGVESCSVSSAIFFWDSDSG